MEGRFINDVADKKCLKRKKRKKSFVLRCCCLVLLHVQTSVYVY